MNIWAATGRLTRDVELRFTQGGTALGKFGLAVNRRYVVNGERKEEVCFIDCTIWGKSAETFVKHFEKGDAVTISGRLNFDQWDDKDGQKRSKHSVTIDQWEFPLSLPSRNEAAPKAAASDDF